MRRKGSIELISWLAGIASFFLALLAFAIDFTPSRSKEKMDKTDTSQVSIHQGQNNEGNQFGVINGSVIINNKGEDKNEKRKDINAVINDNQIGYDINHLDSEIGAPFKKSYGIRQYKYDGCNLEITVDNNNAISEIKVYIQKSCKLNWKLWPINTEGLPQLQDITFGDVIKDRYFDIDVGCLLGCGNAVTTETSIKFNGSHADNWIFTELGAGDNNDHNAGISVLLAKKIINENGEDFVRSMKYLCKNYNLNEKVIGVIDGLKPTYVSLTIDDKSDGDSSIKCD